MRVAGYIRLANGKNGERVRFSAAIYRTGAAVLRRMLTILQASSIVPRNKGSVGKPVEIPFTSSYMQQLLSLVHPEEVLQVSGYKMKIFSPKELHKLSRCQHCHSK